MHLQILYMATTLVEVPDEGLCVSVRVNKFGKAKVHK